MCDVTVQASDGQTFLAHACVLAASSPTLKSSLIHKSALLYELKLDGICGEVWQKLIQFIYSGTLEVPVTNDVLYAAEQLKIESFLAPSKQLDKDFHNSYSKESCSKDGMGADGQHIQSCWPSDKELDKHVHSGDKNYEDDDTVSYSSDMNDDDMSESYDDNDLKLLSSNDIPAICQSPQSNGIVKKENTLPNNKHCETVRNLARDYKSGSSIPQRTLGLTSPATTCKGQFLCDKCPKVYSYKLAFVKHQKRHTEVGRVVRQTSTVTDDENNRYECRLCEKSYASRYLLNRHNILHSDQNPHVCTICGKRFSQGCVVRQHMRTHTGERPYVCSFCGKTFTNAGSLNTHNLTHVSDKPHKCALCRRSFSCRQYLQRHLVVHGALKKHQCLVCGKSFRDSGVLKVHNRVHTGERPLKCTVCGKSFRESSALLTHRRRHTGEKPFKCNTCGKAFTTTSHLYTHERSHDRSHDRSQHLLKSQVGE